MGEEREEEGEAAGLSGGGFLTVKRLLGGKCNTTTHHSIHFQFNLIEWNSKLTSKLRSEIKEVVRSFGRLVPRMRRQKLCPNKCLTLVLDTYTEEVLHQLALLLPTLCTAVGQLDDYAHVTRSQDGLQALVELVKHL